jgi:VanZ family protein
MAPRPRNERRSWVLWRPLLWAAVVLYSGVLWWLSSKPAPEYPPVAIPLKDKVAHVSAYFIWAVLFGLAIRRTWPSAPVRRIAWIMVAAGILYGISDELHQSFVPSRSADPWDVAADALGAALAAAVLARLWSPGAGVTAGGDEAAAEVHAATAEVDAAAAAGDEAETAGDGAAAAGNEAETGGDGPDRRGG